MEKSENIIIDSIKDIDIVSEVIDATERADNKNCEIKVDELVDVTVYRGIKGGIKGAVKGASTGAVTGAFAGGIGAIPGAAKGAVIGEISEGGLEAALGAGGYTIEKGICVYNEKKPEMEKMWKNFKKDVSEIIDKGYKETRKFLGSTKKTAEKSKQNIASFKKDTGKMLNKGYEDFKKFFKIKPKETEKNKKVQKEYVR